MAISSPILLDHLGSLCKRLRVAAAELANYGALLWWKPQEPA